MKGNYMYDIVNIGKFFIKPSDSCLNCNNKTSLEGINYLFYFYKHKCLQ